MRVIIFVLFSLFVTRASADSIVGLLSSAQAQIKNNQLAEAYSQLSYAEDVLKQNPQGEEFLDLVYALLAIVHMQSGNIEESANYARQSIALMEKYARDDALARQYKKPMQDILLQYADNRPFADKMEEHLLNRWFGYIEYFDNSQSVESRYSGYTRFSPSNRHACRFAYTHYMINQEERTAPEATWRSAQVDQKRTVWLDMRKVRYIKDFYYTDTNRVQIIRLAYDPDLQEKNIESSIYTRPAGSNDWDNMTLDRTFNTSTIDVIVGNSDMTNSNLQTIKHMFEIYQRQCSSE